MKFTPRKDFWLGFLMWLPVAAIVFISPLPLINGELGPVGGIVFMAIMLGLASLLAWMWLSTYYVLEEDQLFIRSGFIRKKIPLEQIRKVHPVRSILSSAAFSVNRLEILYGRYDFIHISPKQQEAFIRLLKERCPGATIKG